MPVRGNWKHTSVKPQRAVEAHWSIYHQRYSLYYRHNFILRLYSKCPICSLLATTAATRLVHTTPSLLHCCLSCLPALQCPCVFSSPFHCSPHACRNTPLLKVTHSLSIALRIPTMALKALYNPVPVCSCFLLCQPRPSFLHSPFSLEYLLPCPHSYSHHTPPTLSP